MITIASSSSISMSKKQSALLEQCRATKTPLTIGGNGWADNPNHSAKYRSYGINDLTTNKLVQVISII